MVQLTKSNHFQFGYNGRPFSFRRSPEDVWYVKYGRCSREPVSFKEECLRTARQIRQDTEEPLVVMFSGGVDSEVVVRSFFDAQIEFSVAILRFANELNMHDISWAIKTCQELNIPYKFYDLDLIDFWKNQAEEFAQGTYCISPQLLPTMWLVDQIEGYPILGSGECLLVRTDAPLESESPRKDYPPAPWELWEKEKIAAWYRHFMVRERSGCPGFFQYTPEIMYAYLKDPLVQALCRNQVFGKYSTVSSKLKIYQSHFPDIETRPKYTGYEKVQEEESIFRSHLLSHNPFANQVFKTQYEDLILSLRPHSLSRSVSELLKSLIPKSVGQ